MGIFFAVAKTIYNCLGEKIPVLARVSYIYKRFTPLIVILALRVSLPFGNYIKIPTACRENDTILKKVSYYRENDFKGKYFCHTRAYTGIFAFWQPF